MAFKVKMHKELKDSVNSLANAGRKYAIEIRINKAQVMRIS
jgi:hypothetical protein